MDSVAVLTSLALQYGVPLEDLARKFRAVHFEPAGFTNNPELPQASSLVDYIFRWMEKRFLGKERGTGNRERGERKKKTRGGAALPVLGSSAAADEISTGLACPDCGSVLVFAEGCLTCRSCGYTKCG